MSKKYYLIHLHYNVNEPDDISHDYCIMSWKGHEISGYGGDPDLDRYIRRFFEVIKEGAEYGTIEDYCNCVDNNDTYWSNADRISSGKDRYRVIIPLELLL